MTVEMPEDDMTDADKAEAKRRKESAKDRERLDVAAKAQALASVLGRRMLYRLLENSGMFTDTLGATSEATVALAGKHVVAVALWAELIAISPALVGEMIRENG